MRQKRKKNCPICSSLCFQAYPPACTRSSSVPSPSSVLCRPEPLPCLHSNGALLLGNPQHASNTGRILRKPHLFCLKDKMTLVPGRRPSFLVHLSVIGCLFPPYMCPGKIRVLALFCVFWGLASLVGSIEKPWLCPSLESCSVCPH